MKSARHQAILDLIEQHPIDRQEDLLAHLREEGFDVTQATVSRDIRELQLVKTATADGRYRYVPASASGKVTHSPSRFEMIFRESVFFQTLSDTCQSADSANFLTMYRSCDICEMCMSK